MLANTQEERDRYYLKIAESESRLSHDPSTKVGAVLLTVRNDKPYGIYAGFNKFPDKLLYNHGRLHHRATKYRFMIHAERAALIMALRCESSTEGSTIYVATTNPDGSPSFGGPPCNHCMIELLEAGVRRIVVYDDGYGLPMRWMEDNLISHKMIKESGIEYTSYYR